MDCGHRPRICSGKASDILVPSLTARSVPHTPNAITSPDCSGRGATRSPCGVRGSLGAHSPSCTAAERAPRLLPGHGLSPPAPPPVDGVLPLRILSPCALFCPGLALCWKRACRLHNKPTLCLCVCLGLGGLFSYFVLLGAGPLCTTMWSLSRLGLTLPAELFLGKSPSSCPAAFYFIIIFFK